MLPCLIKVYETCSINLKSLLALVVMLVRLTNDTFLLLSETLWSVPRHSNRVPQLAYAEFLFCSQFCNLYASLLRQTKTDFFVIEKNCDFIMHTVHKLYRFYVGFRSKLHFVKLVLQNYFRIRRWCWVWQSLDGGKLSLAKGDTF